MVTVEMGATNLFREMEAGENLRKLDQRSMIEVVEPKLAHWRGSDAGR